MENYKKLSQENAHFLMNPHVQGVTQSPSLAFNEKTMEFQNSGKKVYRLGFGKSPFPIPDILVKEFVQKSKEKNYLDAKGQKELHHEIAQWLNKSENLSLTSEDIVIGPGSKELLFLIGLTLNYELIVPTPCWVSIIPQVQILGKTAKPIHTKYENKWKLLPQELDEMCQQDINEPERKNKYLYINYPNNPAGTTYNAEQFQQLAKVARKHNLIVVADEIYGKFHYKKGGHQSFARYYPEGTVITTGMSKWVSGSGWRLGFAAFPKELRWVVDAMNKIAEETFSQVSVAIKSASCLAFQEGEQVSKHLQGQRAILEGLGNWCFEKLTKETKLLTHRPEGGIYMYLDFENYRQKLVEKKVKICRDLGNLLLEETGVAILQGAAFGRLETELAFRFSFINFDGATASKAYHEGIQVNENFIQKYCPETVESIEVLIKWLNELAA